MPFILVKSFDCTVLGVIRQGPQTKTTPPPWLATRPDEAFTAECHTFRGALEYLRREPASFVELKHEPVSREEMADPISWYHTLILSKTETIVGF